MKDFIIVIPARRNSKSIPFKNREQINGLTIVEHTIEFSKNLNPKKIILSTDDEFYIDNAKFNKYIHKRPPQLALDETLIADVLLNLIEEKNLYDEFILLLEPTCFPRLRNQLNEFFDGTFTKSKARSIASFSKSPVIKEKIWLSKDGKLTPDTDMWKRRQEYYDQYILTGHYYGFFGKDLKNYYPGLCDQNVFPIKISEEYIDINTFDDLEKLKYIVNK